MSRCLVVKENGSQLRGCGLELSNGHLRQIRETRSLLVQICRGESQFFQNWFLANVGESGESEQNRLANVSESGESEQNRFVNIGESGVYLPSLGKWRRMISRSF